MRFCCPSPLSLILWQLICVHCVFSCGASNIHCFPLNALPPVAPVLSLPLIGRKFCTRWFALDTPSFFIDSLLLPFPSLLSVLPRLTT